MNSDELNLVEGCTNDLYTFVKDVLLFYFESSASLPI